MKLAVFSDVHGNLVALRTLLDHLASGHFAAIYCLGDLFTPYPGSRDIWDLVKASRVECVQGNNEAALLAHLTGQQDYRSDDEVRFLPFLKNAEELAPILNEIQAIPLFRSVPLTDKLHLHLCHFSPDEVLRGLHSSVHFNMEYAAGLTEPVVLTGHMHTFAARDIQGKQVYSVGSAGLPLKGSHQLEYAVVQDHQGEFDISYHLLPYPFEQEITYLLEHGFLRDYGPIAWLAFDEILTQRDRLVRFFKDYLPVHAESPWNYYSLIEEFLRSIGRWKTIAGFLEN